MSKRLVTGMVLALALTSTAAPAALANSVLTPSEISGPVEWSAAQDAVTEAVDSAKASIEASKAALDASKAAQTAAEDAASKVASLATSIDASLSNLKTNMASRSSLLTRIAKKIGA